MTARLQALDDKVAASDPFGLTNYDKLQADVDYLVVAGADIAAIDTGSGNQIAITAAFHKVTAATGTIDNIADGGSLDFTKGQPLGLLFQNKQTLRNNGGGTGNIRTRTGADRVVYPGEVVYFVHDGTNWQEIRPTPGARIGHGVATASVSTSGTTFAAGADVLASALSLNSDGVSDYILRVAAPHMPAGTSTTLVQLRLNLDGADGGIFYRQGQLPEDGLAAAAAIVAPAAGVHTVNARLVNVGSGGTVTLTAGAGGAGNYLPIVVTLEVA